METEFKIEKGIPIPPRTRNRESRYSFIGDMEVGDSFIIYDQVGDGFVKYNNIKAYYSATQYIYKYQRVNNNYKFTFRKVIEDGRMGRRIWRIK